MKRLPVKGYEGLYEVSEAGEVYSLERTVLGKDGVTYPFKAKHKSKHVNVQTGYLQVNLWKNGKGRMHDNHRLAAIAHIPNPENKPEVNHLDGDKLNPATYNLEWSTSSENSQHAVDTGLRTYPARMSVAEFTECLQQAIAGESFASIAERTPYKHVYISIRLRRLAKELNIEDLLDESLKEQRAARARINGNPNLR